MKRRTFVILLVFAVSFATQNAVKVHKFLSISCETSNESVVAIELCELTRNSTLNILFEFVQPFEEIFVSFDKTYFKFKEN